MRGMLTHSFRLLPWSLYTRDGNKDKQEEQMLIQLTLNCLVCIYFSANSVTLSEGQRSSKQCILVVPTGVYDRTNFEEIQYHSLQKTANVEVFITFYTSFTSPRIKTHPIKLVNMNNYNLRLYRYQVSF